MTRDAGGRGLTIMHFDDQDDDDNEDDVNGGHIRTPELSQMDEEER
jgi:hypothetical protein